MGDELSASGASLLSVLVIDDEQAVRASIEAILSDEGYQVQTAHSVAAALPLIEATPFDVILCDLQMPEQDGIAFLEAHRGSIDATIIMMSAYGTLDIARKVLSLGAYDYIEKPFDADALLLALMKATERERLRSENKLLKDQVAKRYSFSNIVSQSAEMVSIFETIKKIADYKSTILINGESGTGKELVARAIHHNSSRRAKRFVAINCGAIPENLLESELFGHKKGAFTDATRDKKGLFEVAHGGTLFLDEVGELPLHLQVKLLRVLQEQEIRPVGDERLVPIDVRVIAATLRDLEQDVIDGRFRDDLYYRLNVVTLRIPPLRERKEDIPILVNFFLKKHRDKLGLPVFGIENDALAALTQHAWPGNIRELENCIERAMILTEGENITAESLPKTIQPSDAPAESLNLDDGDLSIKNHTRTVEENLIRRALTKTNGNRTHAAKLLEISHRTLLYKLKEYDLGDQ